MAMRFPIASDRLFLIGAQPESLCLAEFGLVLHRCMLRMISIDCRRITPNARCS